MKGPRLSRWGEPERGYVDNVAQIAETIREPLRKRMIVNLTITHPSLKEPITFDVVPDGVSSLVRIAYGGTDLVPPFSPVDPEDMDRTLVQNLRRIFAHCQKIDRGLVTRTGRIVS